MHNWAKTLFGQVMALMQSEQRAEGRVNDEQWIDVNTKNSKWWKAPVQGHSLEVLIMLQNADIQYFTAYIRPNTADFIDLEINPANEDVKKVMAYWGTVKTTPQGLSVKLPISVKTSIGLTVQAAVFLMFHVITEPGSFDVRYIITDATLPTHSNVVGLRFGGL